MKTTIYENSSIAPELRKRLWDMPKIEIHVHLEGATDAATIWELARRNKVSLPAATLRAFFSAWGWVALKLVFRQSYSAMSTMKPADRVCIW